MAGARMHLLVTWNDLIKVTDSYLTKIREKTRFIESLEGKNPLDYSEAEKTKIANYEEEIDDSRYYINLHSTYFGYLRLRNEEFRASDIIQILALLLIFNDEEKENRTYDKEAIEKRYLLIQIVLLQC